MFLVLYNPARISDFGGNPLPSRKASGMLYLGTKFISCAEKHNLLCSLEHEFSFVKLFPGLLPDIRRYFHRLHRSVSLSVAKLQAFIWL